MGKHTSIWDRLRPNHTPTEAKTVSLSTINEHGEVETIYPDTPVGRTRLKQIQERQYLENQQAIDLNDNTVYGESGSTNLTGSQLKEGLRNSIQTGYTGGLQEIHQVEKGVETRQEYRRNRQG